MPSSLPLIVVELALVVDAVFLCLLEQSFAPPRSIPTKPFWFRDNIVGVGREKVAMGEQSRHHT